MAKMISKSAVRKTLTDSLALKEPKFLLEKVNGRVVGDIISPSFRGKQDHRRQGMIWDALEEVFGRDVHGKVGLLLAYTPDEWNLGADDMPKPRRKAV